MWIIKECEGLEGRRGCWSRKGVGSDVVTENNALRAVQGSRGKLNRVFPAIRNASSGPVAMFSCSFIGPHAPRGWLLVNV